MGARGPARTPTPILKARGSWLVNERDGEPQYESGSPDQPGFLSNIAAKEWKYVVKLLVPSKVLTQADRMALAVMCEAWSDYIEAVEMLRTATGKQRRLAMINKRAASDTVMKYVQQFGLTPAARSRVQAIEGKDAGSDKKARFFKAS